MPNYIHTATLYYNEIPATPTVTYSEKTGRPIFSTTPATPDNVIELRLSLEQRQTEPEVFAKSGKDSTGIYCTGRILNDDGSVWVDPIPEWLTNGSDFRITWTNGGEGRAYILPSVPSRFRLQQRFGQRIQLIYSQKSITSI